MTCRCGRRSVYTKKYCGESLCKECFSMSISRKVAKTISKYDMIRGGDLVAVAVSGGKDSLALLHILDMMSKTHRFDIHVITIDEGIPGYRDEALEIVSGYCKSLGVEYDVYSYEDLFGKGLESMLEGQDGSSCSVCGVLRRRAMDHAAKCVGANVLATAHNMDDYLQSFVINVLSGDTKRIGWMRHCIQGDGMRKIKPFAEVYESEIVFYAFTNMIPFQSESCPHMNEGVRTEIREFLNKLEERHAGVKNTMYNSVSRLSGMVAASSSHDRTTCGRCGAACTGGICSVCGVLLRTGAPKT